jgi:hypothetical protein
MMTKEDMDNLVARGCGTPGCTHQDETLYLRSSCHTDVPLMIVANLRGDINILCVKCGQPVCVLQNPSDVKKVGGNKDCCADPILWASYTKGSGVVKFTCYFCGDDIYHVILAETGQAVVGQTITS